MFRALLKGIILLSLIVGGFALLHRKEVRHLPGILITQQPVQRAIPIRKLDARGEYAIEAVAEYEITGRVLSTERYRLGKRQIQCPPTLLSAGDRCPIRIRWID